MQYNRHSIAPFLPYFVFLQFTLVHTEINTNTQNTSNVKHTMSTN